MKPYLSLLLLLFISGLTRAQKIEYFPEPEIADNPTIIFATKEISDFLTPYLSSTDKRKIVFHLRRSSSLKIGAFSFGFSQDGSSTHVTLAGEGSTEILHAAHGFMEHLGFRFELTGTDLPRSIRFDTLKARTYTTIPYTRWRGIRQHVNFPMDISSYPLEEAREYLTRMVRMRFNEIAIHSYPNLWHEVYTGDSTEYAGNFFYNRTHSIPQTEFFRKSIRFNQNIFSIPEIEPFYHQREIRSRMAVDWMRELMNHAKRIGLKVHFSIEPRTRGDVSYIIDNCKSALINYPMIDELEINTEELGGWGNTCTDTAVKNVLVTWFGPETLKDTFLINRIQKQQTDLDNLILQVGRHAEAIRQLTRDPWFSSKKVALKLGIYCTITNHADIAYRLVRQSMPECEVTVMPGHGSVRTANHFSNIHKSDSDLQKTTVFSWIEFDGLMFSLQNPVEGIGALFQQLDSTRKEKQLNAVLFNHWRTAENAMAAKYAAESAVKGPIPKQQFYIERAKALGYNNPERFASSMKDLEAIDRISTNDLPNYGFCWLGAWSNGGPYNWIDTATLDKVREMYLDVSNTINSIPKKGLSSFALNELELVQNRLTTSILYLTAFRSACRIQTLKKNADGTYSDTERQKAILMFNEAFTAFEAYMAMHVRKMPDRGCEGTLINLWHGPIYGLRLLRERIAGVPMDTPLMQGAFDGPPLPIRM
jgi:hypothetical protein